MIENTCHLMLNDTYSFVFLRSEGLKYLKKHSLGGGNLLMVIGQFAVLNFLAKVYVVVRNGTKSYVIEKDIGAYEESITNIKKKYPEIWKVVRKYCQKPRLWEVKNETEAFVRLILDYPEDIGISKNEDAVKKVWRDFRNKISHIATIANGNMSLTFEFQKGQDFEYARKFLENVKQKSFFIRNQEEKDKLRKEIIAENNKKGAFTSTEVIGRATNDQVRPDILSKDIQKIMQWLIKKIKNSEFEEDHIKSLYDWLLMQHYVNK
ncbi:MAG: hypothetical protein UT54_C0061G0004 [Candidatus Daviesbacteria bacterium GW2011_GWB1_39_5]|uniref:Uncharacterized protein n=1 Tax=Candidatus Daviesbacteria bacterium GW2011_GWC2_40_12 TaxID=1618431 RepID=A0A0G0QY26_9BACT|nr:MAG: hypothetical protein UT04_C0001G0033 [Candidatus Daviesbacteria bacterium GW2011_GWF2_38_7]KKR16868.1 MAG: hypothetical protein UT45_C0004G0199 [Candidatus Daviesbacteria bacterium GW2011_GWA2_39_33]KKR22828.1 MAG: hypothetical protein UT54_C0061G0004 [Candidatus Daviesbacteria bacterium GW2011_GWB1_39_5]KKR42351.1 MAG: hypothetical protein UT77_C0002G0004 [Candidatus Daviesbacteria bacterium GW2011_GWC2_40_12]